MIIDGSYTKPQTRAITMNKRWFSNFCAVCLVLLLWVLMFLLTGCAGQGMRMEVETENSPCGKKKVSFSTDYQVEDLQMGRTIEGGGDGEGCGGGYIITLGKATTKDAETNLIMELVKMIIEVQK